MPKLYQKTFSSFYWLSSWYWSNSSSVTIHYLLNHSIYIACICGHSYCCYYTITITKIKYIKIIDLSYLGSERRIFDIVGIGDIEEVASSSTDKVSVNTSSVGPFRGYHYHHLHHHHHHPLLICSQKKSWSMQLTYVSVKVKVFQVWVLLIIMLELAATFII